MNKLLPKTKLNPQGFTLVELLVVIVILAILGVVGVALFTSTQGRARDARRKGDITAMSKSMEANYIAGAGYQSINAAWFADGITPSNPSPNGTGYFINSPTTAGFTFCALLEGSPSTGNATTSSGLGMGQPGQYFCKKSAQ